MKELFEKGVKKTSSFEQKSHIKEQKYKNDAKSSFNIRANSYFSLAN